MAWITRVYRHSHIPPSRCCVSFCWQGQVARAWSWRLTSIKYQGLRMYRPTPPFAHHLSWYGAQLSIYKKESMLHILCNMWFCVFVNHTVLEVNGKFTHNFFSVVQMILRLFRHNFNGRSYKLSSNEGEITESNKSLEEGSLTWFEDTSWSHERRDWWKRWQI